MNEPIDGRERHGGIWEDPVPIAEGLVGGDQHGSALVPGKTSLSILLASMSLSSNGGGRSDVIAGWTFLQAPLPLATAARGSECDIVALPDACPNSIAVQSGFLGNLSDSRQSLDIG